MSSLRTMASARVRLLAVMLDHNTGETPRFDQRPLRTKRHPVPWQGMQRVPSCEPPPPQVKHCFQLSGPAALRNVPLQRPRSALLSAQVVALRSLVYLPHRAQTEAGLLRTMRIVSRPRTVNSNAAFLSRHASSFFGPPKIACHTSAIS